MPDLSKLRNKSAILNGTIGQLKSDGVDDDAIIRAALSGDPVSYLKKEGVSDQFLSRAGLLSPPQNQAFASEFNQAFDQENAGLRPEDLKEAFGQFGDQEFFKDRTDVGLALYDVVPSIREDFKKKIGRDATDEEVRAIFSQNNFAEAVQNLQTDPGFRQRTNLGSALVQQGNVQGDIDIGRILSDPAALKNFSSKASNIGSLIQDNAASFNEIARTAESLKSLGLELTSDQRFQLATAGLTNPESVPQLAQSYINTATESKVQQELAGLPAQEQEAISQLDQQLQASQGQFFNETLRPQLERSLSARGLLRSGNLAESLAQAGKQLNTQRESTIAPLSASTRLGGLTRGFENTLRGALESGRSLTDAINFSRNLLTQQREFDYSASQADLNRQFQDQQLQNQLSGQLAIANATASRSSGGSALDLFL